MVMVRVLLATIPLTVSYFVPTTATVAPLLKKLTNFTGSTMVEKKIRKIKALLVIKEAGYTLNCVFLELYCVMAPRPLSWIRGYGDTQTG